MSPTSMQDPRPADAAIEAQLRLIGDHRERVAATIVAPAPPHAPLRSSLDRPPSGHPGDRYRLLAVAALVVALVGGGLVVAGQARSERAGTGAVLGADTADAAGEGSVLDRPGTAQSDRVADDGGGSRSELVDSLGRPSLEPEAPASDEPPAAGGTTSTSEPTVTTIAVADDVGPEIEQATDALARTSAAMAELTTGLADSGAAILEPDPVRPGDELARDPGRRQATSDVAADVVAGHPGCAESAVDLTTFSIDVVLRDCPAADGRSIDGTITVAIGRWRPFELVVYVERLSIGDDLLWLGGTLSFPRNESGTIQPELAGQITVESGGNVFHVDGNVRFLPGRAVLNGDIGYLTGSSVTPRQSVTYRAGQRAVDATAIDLVVAEGDCAPSSGVAEVASLTILGTKDGSPETEDPDQIDFRLDAEAEVTYLATTPLDRMVRIRTGETSFLHPLGTSCSR